MTILNVDARQYNSNEQNRVLFQAFDSLDLGEKIIFTSDNNLKSLKNQLDEERMNVFDWEYLKEGPEEWKVLVSKRYYNFI